MALEYVNPSDCDTILFFLRGFAGFPFNHLFSDAGSKKHQCPGLNWVANAATSLALCEQVSVSPFFFHSMSLIIDMNMIPSSKDSGFCPFSFL